MSSLLSLAIRCETPNEDQCCDSMQTGSAYCTYEGQWQIRMDDLKGKLKVLLGLFCINHYIFSLGLEPGDPKWGASAWVMAYL